MNPFLILLIILGAVLLWFLLSALYVPIGRYFSKMMEHSKSEIKKDK